MCAQWLLSKIFEKAQPMCVSQLVVDESKSTIELKPFAYTKNPTFFYSRQRWSEGTDENLLTLNI